MLPQASLRSEASYCLFPSGCATVCWPQGPCPALQLQEKSVWNEEDEKEDEKEGPEEEVLLINGTDDDKEEEQEKEDQHEETAHQEEHGLRHSIPVA